MSSEESPSLPEYPVGTGAPICPTTLGTSKKTVQRDWERARVILCRQLTDVRQ